MPRSRSQSLFNARLLSLTTGPSKRSGAIYHTMSRQKNLESAMNASVGLKHCVSMSSTPQKSSHSHQEYTALGSPFLYQPPKTSPRSQNPPPGSRSLCPKENSVNLEPPPLPADRDESLKVLGSPFRYQPPKASPRPTSPSRARTTTRALQQDRQRRWCGKALTFTLPTTRAANPQSIPASPRVPALPPLLASQYASSLALRASKPRI